MFKLSILAIILIFLLLFSPFSQRSNYFGRETVLNNISSPCDGEEDIITGRDLLYCSSEGGELREKPSLSSELLGILEPDTPVIVNSKGPYGWINIQLRNGKTGWVHTKFLSEEPENNYVVNSFPGIEKKELASRGSYVAAGVVQTAYKYMGVPYVWGGSTPSGFDCSGFVQWVYSQNGVHISRTADIQYTEGAPVKELEPGDLVFFTTYAPGASHVGIYLGCTLFIHASSSGSVRISSLDEDYYQSVFLGGRRYFN